VCPAPSAPRKIQIGRLKAISLAQAARAVTGTLTRANPACGIAAVIIVCSGTAHALRCSLHVRADPVLHSPHTLLRYGFSEAWYYTRGPSASWILATTSSSAPASFFINMAMVALMSCTNFSARG